MRTIPTLDIRYTLLITVILCAVSVFARTSKPVYKKAIRFSSGISWGKPSFFVNGENKKPVTINSSDSLPESVVDYKTTPLQYYQCALTFTPPKHIQFIIGMTYRRQRVFHEDDAGPVLKGAIRFTYQSYGFQPGFTYEHKKGPMKLNTGMLFSFAYATWLSDIIRYSSEPTGNVSKLEGDKNTNAANGIEIGVKITTGIEYVILNKIGIGLSANAHPSISSLGFIQDWHLWENTEAYKDHHTETLLDCTIDDDTTFMIAPPLLSLSLELTYYF